MKKKSNARQQPSQKPAEAHTAFPAISPNNDVESFSVREFTAHYHVSQEALTRMTGFSLRAVSNWNQGAAPSTSTTRRLTEVKRLFSALENLVSPEAIGSWVKAPNPAFAGSTPLQVIERGEADRIWRMIYELESGEPA